MRVLLVLSHSIEEHDQLKLLSSLGYEVFSLGGYINPHAPHDPKRPALPEVTYFPHLHEAVDALGADDNIGSAASRIPAPILEWLGTDGVIIFHHYLGRLWAQWGYLREWREAGGRVIWRTVGQSVEANENEARPYRADGLEIVRYSPKERAIPGYAGEDAVIRFYKDPEEWGGWTGEIESVTNVTQGLLQRAPWTNPQFWIETTEGLPNCPTGPGSEELLGKGEIDFPRMKRVLQRHRCYLYTGTQPASYTLGLLEALVTGIPVVSIGASHMQIFPYGPSLFEGAELAPLAYDDPVDARAALERLLDDYDFAAQISQHQRWRAVKEFGIDAVGAAWRTYLGQP